MSEVQGPRWRTQAAIGVGLLALAAAVVWDAQRLPPGAGVGVGPAAAMKLIGGFVALLGVAHVVGAWRRRAQLLATGEIEAPADRGNHASLAWVFGALVGLIVILQVGGGFVLGSAWLFVGTARGFGQKISAKSVVIGVVLSVAVYLFFTQALSLALPSGPLERLLG